MIPSFSQIAASRQAPAPLVLIAEDDARVLELLQLAFTSEHFRVITALDGDEAIRRALAERPDLVVLDVQMPRKNGFEVCDWLRHDPEDPQVPIVFVSGSGDTDVRIEGFARGADDFLSKPFSPRELVARCRRLLARSAEAREHRRRSAELERELGRAQGETRRVHADLAQERRLRELAFAAGRELCATLDPDELVERLAAAAARQLGQGRVALLVPRDGEAAGAVLAPRQVRGSRADARFESLSLDPNGEVAAVLAGLGRPVLLEELQRRGGPRRDELAPFIAAGVALLAPLRGPQGVEALLVADERPDGLAWSAADRDAIAVLCDLAAIAYRNARRFREAQDDALALAAGRAAITPRARLAAGEADRIVQAAARALVLPAREAALARHASAFGPWAWGEEGAIELERLERRDPTRRVAELRALVACGESLEPAGLDSTASRHAALLTGVCARYQVGRAGGRSVEESWRTALSQCGPVLDPALAGALTAAFESTLADGHVLQHHGHAA